MTWQQRLAPLVRAIEKRYDAWKYRVYYALGGPGPIKIQPYRGFGVPGKLFLMGRVLEERGITSPTDTDGWWINLLNMVKRLQSCEVPGARLVARFRDAQQEITADEEGMFELSLEYTGRHADADGWHTVDLRLLEPLSDHQTGPVQATGEVLVPAPVAPYGVISDIDDTVIQSDVSSLIGMVRTTMLGNARTRLPLPGVAAFYRALHNGPGGTSQAPMFYVSNGLWNLYDLLEDFFALNKIPGGPILLLRNWGVYQDEILPTEQREHKLKISRRILELYADMPFILLGDSSEADPEIYAELVHQYGERILAVYIRNVSPDLGRPAAIRSLADEIVRGGSELILAQDSLSMARHALDRGWIQEGAIARIREEQMRGRPR